jgi:D-arabinose 5-phosphate isomerase GutQ/GTP-binding protein EngB required for normal cell division
MSTQRVFKKISTPFDTFGPTGAIVMINLVDPQISTVRVFLDALRDRKLPYICVANKSDRVSANAVRRTDEALGESLIVASMVTGRGTEEVRAAIEDVFDADARIAILGVFNSGKTSLLARLTGLDLEVGDLPGTTLAFEEHPFGGRTLIDTVGQLIDVDKPLMVSVDLADCADRREKLARVLRQDAEAILASVDTALDGLSEAVETIKVRLERGGKVVLLGAGASALVAMEAAGQGMETGIPVLAFTNNLADCHPVSFSKGTGEEEGALARYAAQVVNANDIAIGVSASGGTGFVYDFLARARALGAATIAITENVDTPLGKAAELVVKSNAKPEGPSSSKIQAAHLAMVHALMLTLADERGVTAEESIGFMLPEAVKTKKMGIK